MITSESPPAFDAMGYVLSLIKDGTLSIDDDGQVWRHYVRDRHGNRHAIAARRAENPTKKGYLAVTLGVPGTRRTRGVLAHCLVWAWLHGRKPDWMQINHKDLNKKNNRPGNLELTDQSGNIRHSYANGRTAPWTVATEWRPGKPRISDEARANVIEMSRSGESIADISRATGISKTHVARIIQKGGAR